ncbi:DMT family transporter [Kangiella sp. TOML190]|uniref:DMT family transporter n=1 Tax=Kangiella sp. TOML190 TaxID=2931351 RepID=UPI0020425E81|nr:DMT family transporter [Kangiella sp. TOML190]
MQTSFWRLIGLAIIAVFFMALVPVTIKQIQVDPWLVGFVRLAISVVGLYLIAKLLKQSVWSKKENWPAIMLIGFTFSIHWLSYFYSIQLSTASIAAIGVSTYGAHLLLLGWWFHGQKPTLFELSCVLLAFVGVYFVLPEFDLKNDMTLGLLLGVLSGALYACLPILHQKYRHINHQRRAFGQFFIAMWLFALGLPFLPAAEFELSKEAIMGLVILGVLSTLIGHSLWVKISTELNHVVTSIVYYLYVPIAMALSFFLLNEELTANKLIGAGLVICANIAGIYYRYRHSKTTNHA